MLLGKKIVLVEDDVYVSRALRKLLQRAFSRHRISVFPTEYRILPQLPVFEKNRPPKLFVIEAMTLWEHGDSFLKPKGLRKEGSSGGIRIARWVLKKLPNTPVVLYSQDVAWKNIYRWFKKVPEPELFRFVWDDPSQKDHSDLLTACLEMAITAEMRQ